MAYLIDTDIIIYSLKNDDHVKQKFRENQNIPKSISVITYGELIYEAKKSMRIPVKVATYSRNKLPPKGSSNFLFHSDSKVATLSQWLFANDYNFDPFAPIQVALSRGYPNAAAGRICEA